MYLEKHQVILSESGEYLYAYVDYFDPNGDVFAEKTLDYSKNLFAPDMMFYDMRSDERFSVFLNINSSYISVLNEVGAKRSETIIKLDGSQLVVDAGFDRFIETNWLRLRKEKKIEFVFLALTRAQFINFEAIETSLNGGVLKLELYPRNFFINMLVDPISLEYDQKTKRLVLFEGLSNIERFEKGKRTQEHHLVRIDYDYLSGEVNE